MSRDPREMPNGRFPRVAAPPFRITSGAALLPGDSPDGRDRSRDGTGPVAVALRHQEVRPDQEDPRRSLERTGAIAATRAVVHGIAAVEVCRGDRPGGAAETAR